MGAISGYLGDFGPTPWSGRFCREQLHSLVSSGLFRAVGDVSEAYASIMHSIEIGGTHAFL